MKKRILPALLALCMVMSLLPATVFAEAAKNADCACDECECSTTDHASGIEECTKCQACEKCNPCGVDGCTKVATHTDKHNNETCSGKNTNADGKVCGAEHHVAGCGKFEQCDFGGAGGKCTKEKGHDADNGGVAHNNSKCGNSNSSGTCGATSHEASCDRKCGCTNQDVHGEGKTCTATKTGDSQDAKSGAFCAACLKNAKCNPCNTEGAEGGCTLYKGHAGAHNGTKCTADTQCVAAEHEATCPRCCGYSANLNTNTGKTGVSGCTLTYGHSASHNTSAETCTKDAWCPAKVHDDATYDSEKDEVTKACPKWTPCTLCVPVTTTTGQGESAVTTTTPVLKCAGHAGNHTNTVCLGYKSNSKCGATTHIAGCPKAQCECLSGAAELQHPDCTGEAGCPACAAMENCNCPVCKANPGLGVVTDNEGNEVDPAEPTEPTVPEVPEKAEDFTDIDGEDASQEWLVKAVQTMLDNEWMNGVGGSKFEPGVEANTSMVLTVVARMSDEKISGPTWADDAKAWAEKNELTEGIDLESDTIARKDIILLLWRLAGKTDSTQELEFTDVEGLEGDYLTALKWAVEKGIVMGNGDGTVTPDGILTRGQLAALVARYADNVK